MTQEIKKGAIVGNINIKDYGIDYGIVLGNIPPANDGDVETCSVYWLIYISFPEKDIIERNVIYNFNPCYLRIIKE